MTPPAQNLVCRSCGAPLGRVMVDLGSSPLANSFLAAADLARAELFLRSASTSASAAGSASCRSARRRRRSSATTPTSPPTPTAGSSMHGATSSDGARASASARRARSSRSRQQRRLPAQYFVDRGVPVLGIEPAANVAAGGARAGIPTEVRFFGREAARDLVARGSAADLLLGNNVLAHVPDLNDFVAGLAILLKADGVLTMEFPHLVRLIDGNQFDTIYHEHFSYFSFVAVERVFAAHGLELFDVEELPTHGGSLRIYARHGRRRASVSGPCTPRVAELLARERAARRRDAGLLRRLRRDRARDQARPARVPDRAKSAPARSIVGYGAPAKGNTLLNYCGIAATSSTTRSTAARTSRAASSRAPASRSAPRRRSSRPGPTTSSSCRGICATRSPSRWRRSATGAVASWSRSPGWSCCEARSPSASRGPSSSSSSRWPTSAASSPAPPARASSPPPGSRAGSLQTSLSFNPRRGTLRGLHYQAAPHAEAKLVRCVRGRSTTCSSTCGRSRPPTASTSRSSSRPTERNAVYIPAGVAHGFLTLTDDAKCSTPCPSSRRRRPPAACAGTIRRSASSCPRRCR